MADNQSKSILLQVAFKEAASAVLGTKESVKDKTRELFQVLLELHDELGIEIKDRTFNRGGGQKKERELPKGAAVFAYDDGQWIDYRKAKEAGTVKAKHPDFKSFDGKQSIWEISPQGDPNEEAAPLREAAKTAIF